MPLRDHADAAVPTVLDGSIDASTLSITIADASGWPSGGLEGPFIVTINHNLSNEERVSIASRTGLSLTVGERGFGDTTPSAHSSGSEIFHSWSAVEAEESNDHINDVGDDHLQYMRSDGTRHDLTARHEAGASVPTAAPGTILPDAVAAEGSGPDLARATHTHAIDAAAPTPVGAVTAEGASTSFVRADHVHILGAASVATVAQHNDLIRPVVIQETAPGTPIIGQRWVQPSTVREFMWNGSAWIFSGGRNPGTGVSSSSNQSISGNTAATMTFGSGDVDYDTEGNMAVPGSNFKVIRLPGRYRASLHISRQPGGAFLWSASITLNGTTNQVASLSTNNTAILGSAIAVSSPVLNLAVNDNLRARVFNGDGGNRAFVMTRFTVELTGGVP